MSMVLISALASDAKGGVARGPTDDASNVIVFASCEEIICFLRPNTS